MILLDQKCYTYVQLLRNVPVPLISSVGPHPQLVANKNLPTQLIR